VKDTELYEKLLGVEWPWRVKEVKMNVEEQKVKVEIECVEKVVWAVEGQRVHVHGWERRQWRHLDTCGFATEIEAEVPRIKYPDGKTEMATVPWAGKGSRFTKRFEVFAVAVLRAARSVSEACTLLDLSWGQAHRIMSMAVERGLRRRSTKGLARVGMDEKSFLAGQSYVSALCDLDEARVLEVVEGASQASGEALLASLPAEQRTALEAVAMDMSAAFIAAAQAQAPQADIVHDRFHVSQHLNEAVDKVRRIEHRQLQGEGDDVLSGQRFVFLYSPENLDRERRANLRQLLAQDLKVGRAWTLKEHFRHFWERANAQTALAFFEQWYGRAVRSRLPPIIKVAKMLKKHLFNLLTYHWHRITNAVAEGLNSRIQALKANARGFRSFHNFRIRILFFLGKLNLTPS
jgi:transposase